MIENYDTFQARTTGGAWGNATDGTAWSTKQGTPTLSVSSTVGQIASSSGDVTMRLGNGTTTDQDVCCKIVSGNSSDKVGVIARLSGTGSTETWYGLRWYGGNLHLEKNTAGTITDIVSDSAQTMTVGTSYTFRLRCTGTSIQGRYWASSGSEPTSWTLTATDSAQASGGWGLFANATTSTPDTFAYFAAQDGFVTKSSTNLIYGGTNFYFSGGNCYWMGLQEVPTISYPTNKEVDDALATLQEMGATVVRCHTMGISVGTSLSVETALATYNTGAFTSMDYAIKRIGDFGLKAIFPLVDNWAYYHGGKHNFTDYEGDSNNTTVFYTDATVINDFKAYIDQIINRVNAITGIIYREDSTILCWETGNELSYWPHNGNPPDNSWVTSIVNHIKNQDSSHLVMSGTTPPQTSDYSISNVDICTNHYYPLNTTTLASDATAVTNGGKVFIVGEYDWTGQFGGSTLTSFISAVEGNNLISGDLWWGLYSHSDAGTGGFNEYGHDYTLYYPGENPVRATRVQQLRTHAYTMSGLSVPAAATPAAPVLLAVNKLGLYAQPVWRGVPIAASYNVEKSVTGPSGTFNTVASGVTDWTLPVFVSGVPGGTSWWRVKAANNAGTFGSYSNIIQIKFP